MKLLPTPSQTVGPYLHVGLTWMTIDHVATRDARGEHLTIEGRVLDGEGKPVPDALIEIWQADADGQYSSSNFRGFGRAATDAEGRFRFLTIRPGAVHDRCGGQQAPHIL